jgi:hypothetical protein
VRRSSVAADLEIVDLGGATPDNSVAYPSRSRRRWPIVSIVALVGVVGLAVPGRTQVAAGELRRLDRTWTEFTADEAGHRDAIASVWYAALTPDQVLVNRAILDLDGEESDRLATLDHRLGTMVLIDGGLRGLRSAMGQVVGRRAAVLHHAEQIRLRSQMGPVQSVEAGVAETPDMERVAALLMAARDHFGLTRTAVAAHIQRYRSADGVLAAMTADERESRRAVDGIAVARTHRHGQIPLPF